MNTEGKNVINRKCVCGKRDTEQCDFNCLTVILEPSPTAQWQKCGEDCDCKDECKQLVADTPQIMQELANRDQWQKEAEELSWKEFPMNHLTPKGEKETIIENRGIYVLGFIKAREIRHAEHADHLAQLQGEIDDSVSELRILMRFIIDDMHPDLQKLVLSQFDRLRTITQTKMSE